MVHLLPLPGSPNYGGSMGEIIDRAVKEAVIYEKNGVDGIQIENYWDMPYQKAESISLETVSSLSVVANEIQNAVSIPFGVNIHMNGSYSALAVAAVTGASWIRVFEYVSAYVSYTGITEGNAGEIARYRNNLGVKDQVSFFTDVYVKHGSHFLVSDRTVAELAYDAQEQGSDAIIITGFETGIAPNKEKIIESKAKLHLPVIIGSGVTKDNVEEILSVSDAIIAGSTFKEDGKIENIVDAQRVAEFMAIVDSVRNDSNE